MNTAPINQNKNNRFLFRFQEEFFLVFIPLIPVFISAAPDFSELFLDFFSNFYRTSKMNQTIFY